MGFDGGGLKTARPTMAGRLHIQREKDAWSIKHR